MRNLRRKPFFVHRSCLIRNEFPFTEACDALDTFALLHCFKSDNKNIQLATEAFGCLLWQTDTLRTVKRKLIVFVEMKLVKFLNLCYFSRLYGLIERMDEKQTKCLNFLLFKFQPKKTIINGTFDLQFLENTLFWLFRRSQIESHHRLLHFTLFDWEVLRFVIYFSKEVLTKGSLQLK